MYDCHNIMFNSVILFLFLSTVPSAPTITNVTVECVGGLISITSQINESVCEHSDGHVFN